MGSPSKSESQGADLAHNLAVDHGLVSGLYGCGVGQDGYVSIKFPGGLWLRGLTHQDHALPHQIALHLLQGQGCRLACHYLQAAKQNVKPPVCCLLWERQRSVSSQYICVELAACAQSLCEWTARAQTQLPDRLDSRTGCGTLLFAGIIT